MHKLTTASLFIAGFLVTAFIIFNMVLWLEEQQDIDYLSSPLVGVLVPIDPPQSVPNIPIVTESGTIPFHQLKYGKLLVLNLWASWCQPCVREMPLLGHLQKIVAQEDISVIAISEDPTIEQASSFLKERGLLSLGVYQDPQGKLAQELGATGLPATYILEPSGRVIASLHGETAWDSEEMVHHIKILAASFR